MAERRFRNPPVSIAAGTSPNGICFKIVLEPCQTLWMTLGPLDERLLIWACPAVTAVFLNSRSSGLSIGYRRHLGGPTDRIQERLCKIAHKPRRASVFRLAVLFCPSMQHRVFDGRPSSALRLLPPQLAQLGLPPLFASYGSLKIVFCRESRVASLQCRVLDDAHPAVIGASVAPWLSTL